MPEYLETPEWRRIAYQLTPGAGPAVVFLGGYRSDMTGTKAVALEAWAQARGRAFLRFDYSGHGQSSGAFLTLGIADWLADARAALGLVAGPVVLVGSSMGGWLSLLLARAQPERVAGLVTIAAAPDFADALMEEFSPAERAALVAVGHVDRPSEYSPEPYQFSRVMIEQGRANRIFDRPLRLGMPVRFLQGSADADVPQAVALRLFDHAEGPDLRLTLVKGADHRFSTPDCLRLIERSVAEVLGDA